jgi:F-type H+-transporting ATPase subunit epsilon
MTEQQTNAINDKKITLNITTPRGVKYIEKADNIIMRCIDGNMGVLLGHQPVSAILGDGILRIINDGVEKKLAVFGGIAEIGKTTINIFSTIAQLPEEIDRMRAQKDFKSAENAILEASEELKVRSTYILLRRSLVRIEVSLHLEDEEYTEDEDTN